MAKKSAAKAKSSSSKSPKKQQLAGKKRQVVQMKSKPTRRPSLQDDPRFAQAVQNYEAGIKAMQEHKYDRAKALFQKVVAGPSPELADRAAVHMNSCNQQLEDSSTSFKSPEEHYDYAVSLMNMGDYEQARAHLEKLSRQVPKADYVWYGLSLLDCLTGRYEDALRHLNEAIHINPAVRFQARNDSDFQNLADDPRFTELLYPEIGVDGTPTPTPWDDQQ